MHLGLYHEPLHTDGRTYDTYGAYARYVLTFARHFEQVTVFAPVTREETYFSGVPLEAANVRVVPLPWFMTHAQAYRRAWKIARALRGHCDELDVLNCRNTAPLAYLLWWWTRRRGVPFIYHFSSDPFELIARSPKYRGPLGYFARAAYNLEFAIQKHIARRNYSFSDGSALAQRLHTHGLDVEPIVLSTLLPEDYYERADTCTGPVVRLMYAGALRSGKGLDDLVAALGLLRQQGRAVELDLVGTGEMEAPLRTQATQLGVESAVHFRGYATLGPQLNAFYNAADIFVLPSLSEGSPRVITEALGHSLPIVATPVGNIAESLDHGRRGVLVPLRDPAGLAAGIAKLLDDAAFRQSCIRAGFAFAQEHGLERFVARMAEKAKELRAARVGKA